MNLSYGKNIISMNYANVSFTNVMDETSKFKQILFRAYMRGDKVQSSVCKHYFDVLKDFVESWNKEAIEIESSIKSAAGNATESIPYSYIKDYIYGNYDYASVLPYVDGLISGFTDGNFKDERDSSSFENHVKDNAFPNRLNTTGGLVEDVVMISKTAKVASREETAMFNVLKSQRIFNHNDADIMLDAIKKTIDYLCSSEEAVSKIDTLFQTNPKNAIIIINSSSDYIAYTVLAFATRVLAIYAYSKPWIEQPVTEAVEAESTAKDEPSETPENIGVVVIDELLCRDHTKYLELIDKFKAICKEIGVDEKELKTFVDDERVDGDNDSLIKGIVVGSKYHDVLIKNGLYQFIMEDPVFKSEYFRWNKGRYDSIVWFHDKLDSAVINGMQGNGEIVSPKQDLVNIIRLVGNDITSDPDYIKLAEQCFNIFTFLMNRISNIQYEAERTFNDFDRNLDLKEKLAGAESAKILRELYCEIATAVFHRLMDIKLHLDKSKDDEFKNIMASISIKVPGGEPDDVTHKDDMMVGVPDTTRTDIVNAFGEAIDIYYMIPEYEFLSMYDEYARTTLGDDYYLEAGEDGFFNKIIAFIKQAVQRLIAYFNDKNRQRAIKWCKDHADELKSMTFSGKMEGLVDFKKDINIDFLNTIVEKLNNFNAKTANNDFDAFKKSIYGKDEIYNLFFGANGEKLDAAGAREKLEKLIFTGNANLNQPITLVDDQIKDKLINVWLPIMITAEESISNYGKATNSIADAIKKVKDTLAAAENINEAVENEVKVTPGDQQTATPSASEEAINADSASGDNKNRETPADNKSKDNEFKSKVGAELDTLSANIIIPMCTYTKDYYTTVYSYIQKAYTLGRK